jgi:hyaluronoglucosaminidase
MRRWGLVVAVFTLALVPSCTDMTADAEPVLHSSEIPGLSARAEAGTEAYVCNFGYTSDPGAAVTPVDLADAVADAPITTGTLPDAIASTPDGRLILVADEGEDLLTILNAGDGDVVARVQTGVEPDAVAVSPDGRIALVANIDGGTVTPVNLKTMRAGKPVRVGPQPDAVAIGGSDGEIALVADLGSGSVTPINLETMRAGPSISVGDEPDAIAMSPNGGTAFVTDLGSNSVRAVNMTTLTAGPVVPVGVPPTGIATDPDPGSSGPVAWISGGSSLVAVSFTDLDVIGEPLAVGHLAEAVAITANGSTAWVADGDPYVTEIDLITGRAIKSVPVGGRPSAIVIPPALH